MTITVVVPVYGESEWLVEALTSVVEQTSSEWKLLIADDGSDDAAKLWLQNRLEKLEKNYKIKWIQRPFNLGLFKNLNQAIQESSTDWILLLCSDDKLEPSAITSLQQLRQKWGGASLILSTFESINADGSLRPPDNSQHHDQLLLNTGLIAPEQMLPGLLRLGSINGNLTGMAFSKEHWLQCGPFREDWRHAADWEWLIRASETKPVLLNRNPIASVRTHDEQLSVRNRKSGHECQEVAIVVSSLLKHQALNGEPHKREWASHVMQFQLWNLLKGARQGNWSQLGEGIKAIHKSSGIRQTSWSLLRWLPERWKRVMKPSAH